MFETREEAVVWVAKAFQEFLAALEKKKARRRRSPNFGKPRVSHFFPSPQKAYNDVYCDLFLDELKNQEDDETATANVDRMIGANWREFVKKRHYARILEEAEKSIEDDDLSWS